MDNASDQRQLLAEMRRVRDHVSSEGGAILERWGTMLKRGGFLPGATNLAHYLAFRELDLRPLQEPLVTLGLSGLGRSESRVLPTLDAVIANLELLCGANSGLHGRPDGETFWAGTGMLKRAADALFGPPVEGRVTRILVTMAPRAAKDADHVQGLVAAGMDAARINCAHDGPKAWTNMIKNIRQAASGPYVAEGIAVLDNVLRRMEAHMNKKSPQLRALSAWAGAAH